MLPLRMYSLVVGSISRFRFLEKPTVKSNFGSTRDATALTHEGGYCEGGPSNIVISALC